MSNVKVNGNTYNSVTSVKLALADGTGYATYKEGTESAKDWIDTIMNVDAEEGIGDITRDDIYYVNLDALAYRTVGTISFPNASKMRGDMKHIVADNILFPKLASIISNVYIPNISLRNATVSGVVDFGTASVDNSMNQPFLGATIGTLKIGNFNNVNGMFQNATITNLVWNHTSITAANMGGNQGLGCTGAKITNAYVPDSLYDAIKALMDAGTLTTVTNLYKISEWSDD